jgi:hypothetical protein
MNPKNISPSLTSAASPFFLLVFGLGLFPAPFSIFDSRESKGLLKLALSLSTMTGTDGSETEGERARFVERGAEDLGSSGVPEARAASLASRAALRDMR